MLKCLTFVSYVTQHRDIYTLPTLHSDHPQMTSAPSERLSNPALHTDPLHEVRPTCHFAWTRLPVDTAPYYPATLHVCYLTLSHVPTPVLLPARSALVDALRPLIASSTPPQNDVYLFISCLGALDPTLWAGTSADVPAALEGWEVERIVALLESEDKTIRVKVGIPTACFSSTPCSWGSVRNTDDAPPPACGPCHS